MDAKKALYRAKLKQAAAAQKKDKRIDSPLIRYNENDQPVCRVCDIVLKSESHRPAHQASRKHHEAIAKFKATAAGQVRNIAESEPQKVLVNKVHSSSTLPADFFDKNETGGQKTAAGLGTRNKIEAGPVRSSANFSDSVSSEMILGKRKSSIREEPIASERKVDEHVVNVIGRTGITPSKHLNYATQKSNSLGARAALPEGFFDNMDVDATGMMGDSEVKQVEGTCPDSFIDNKDVGTNREMDGLETKRVSGSLPEVFFNKEDARTNINRGGSEVKKVKDALPEGFFDNKDADLRARGIEPVKIDIKDEYKEFEKLIQEDLHEVDERYEEEEIDAAEVREEEETLEQKAYRERVDMLKKKQMELKAARFGGQKTSKMGKGSSDEESSSDEDDDKGASAFDWRAKHL